MTNQNENLDYLNLFDKLANIQSKLSEEIFIKQIGFIKAEEVWKTFTENSNNLLIFYKKLNLQNKVIFIKYLDYKLLSKEEVTEKLKDKIKLIEYEIINFERSLKNGMTKLDLYEFYNKFFNVYNKEQILVDNGLTYPFKESEVSTDEYDANDELVQNIMNWIDNFKIKLSLINFSPIIVDDGEMIRKDSLKEFEMQQG